MNAEWTITPYAVGLLLNAPDDVAPDLVAIYRAAETARRLAGYHPAQSAGKAIHAVVVQHYANVARDHGDPDLAEWLARAAAVVVTDAAIDLDTFVGAVDGSLAR